MNVFTFFRSPQFPQLFPRPVQQLSLLLQRTKVIYFDFVFFFLDFLILSIWGAEFSTKSSHVHVLATQAAHDAVLAIGRPTFDAERRSEAVTLDQILECRRGVSRCLRADAPVVLLACELVELVGQEVSEDLRDGGLEQPGVLSLVGGYWWWFRRAEGVRAMVLRLRFALRAL